MFHLVKTFSRGRCLVAAEQIGAGCNLIVESPFVQVQFEANVESSIALACLICQKLLKDPAARKVFMRLCAPSKTSNNEAKKDKLRNLLGHITSAELDLDGIFSRIDFNVFTIQDTEMKALGIGVYIQAAMINHSCCPNCIQTFVNNKLYIRSIREIKEGEEITIAYIDVAKPTWYRQMMLKEMYKFTCSCTSCQLLNENDFWTCQKPLCKGNLDNICDADLALQFTNRCIETRYNPTHTSVAGGYCAYTCLYPYIYSYIYVSIHTYIYTSTHEYLHTHFCS